MTKKQTPAGWQVQLWNKTVPVGTAVYMVNDSGNTSLTETRSRAWVTEAGDPIVKVEGVSGGYLLTRFMPVEQTHKAIEIDTMTVSGNGVGIKL